MTNPATNGPPPAVALDLPTKETRQQKSNKAYSKKHVQALRLEEHSARIRARNLVQLHTLARDDLGWRMWAASCSYPSQALLHLHTASTANTGVKRRPRPSLITRQRKAAHTHTR